MPSGPTGAIGAGPDGQLWVTLFGAYKLARVFPGGPLPSAERGRCRLRRRDQGRKPYRTITLTNDGTTPVVLSGVS